VTTEGGEKENKIGSEDEFQGYVSLDQARDLAIQHARQNTEFYGSVYAGVDLVWEVIGQLETADHYEVNLSYRPAGRFRGESGIEKFTIGKTGEIELRQILYELEGEAIKSPHPLLIGLAGLVMIAGIAGIVFVVGDFGGDDTTPVPVAAVVPSATPTATETSTPTQTPTSVSPSATATPIPLPTRTRTPTPTATSNPIATPAPAVTQTPTPTAMPINTPTPARTATPTLAPTAPPSPSPSPTRTQSPSPSPTTTPSHRYRLILSVADGDLGTVEVAPVSVDQRYEAGTVVVLTAKCLFDFVSWEGVVPAMASSESTTIAVTIDRDRTLIASCAEPRATPTPSPTPGPALTLKTTQWEVAWFTLDQNKLSLPLNITSTLPGYFSEYPVGQFIGFRASATIHISPAAEPISIDVSGRNGFILWVDDQLVIDEWEPLTSGDGFRSDRAVVALPSGTHRLDIEWYVLEAGATASFSVNEPHALAWCELEESTREATRTLWDAQWYESRDLSIRVRKETFPATFDMKFGNITQAFVAKTTINVPGTDDQFIEFQIGNDDGAMLLLDDQIIFDDWEGGPYGATEVGALLSPGKHSLELRYWNQATFFGNSRVFFDISASDVFLWCE
jgi:hypothetical protein